MKQAPTDDDQQDEVTNAKKGVSWVFRTIAAILFALGGIAAVWGILAILAIGHAMAGMSAGSTHGESNLIEGVLAVFIGLCPFLYFLLSFIGVLACKEVKSTGIIAVIVYILLVIFCLISPCGFDGSMNVHTSLIIFFAFTPWHIIWMIFLGKQSDKKR